MPAIEQSSDARWVDENGVEYAPLTTREHMMVSALAARQVEVERLCSGIDDALRALEQDDSGEAWAALKRVRRLAND